jgi:hypothetical protein
VVKPIVDILDTDARAADSEGEYDTQIVAKLTPVQLAVSRSTPHGLNQSALRAQKAFFIRI